MIRLSPTIPISQHSDVDAGRYVSGSRSGYVGTAAEAWPGAPEVSRACRQLDTEGESAENPLFPAEKWSGTITSEWFSGNFAVVRHTNEKFSVSGEIHSLEVIAYDRTAKTYTWYGVDDHGGGGDLGKASIAGDVLTAVWESQEKGKTYKFRGTLKGLGSDRLTFVMEYSEDGTTWKPFLHSTDTRVKSK